MLHTLRDTKRGWIFALTRSENSNWGVADREIGWILNGQVIASIGGRKHFQSESRVWGKINNPKSVEPPKQADGIAFYHPRGKAIGLDGKICKVAELSVIGTIQEVVLSEDKHSVVRLTINFDAEVVESFSDSEEGIYLDKTMEPVERAMTAGIRHGQVATFWEIPWREWRSLLTFAKLPLDA